MNNHHDNTSTATPKAGEASCKTMDLDAQRRSTIRKGCRAIRLKGTDAVAYVTDGTSCCAYAFRGRRLKAEFRYSFTSEKARDARLARWFAEVAESTMHKQQRAAFAHTLKAGDVLKAVWGYEQTNVDFYQVTALLGSMVEIRAIAQLTETTGHMTGIAGPKVNDFIGKPMRKRVREGNCIRIESYCYASPYEMTEVIPGVKVGSGVRFSTYA